MNNSLKNWLIAAAALILIGAVMITVAMSSTGWDIGNFKYGSEKDYVENTYEIDDSFKNILIDTDTADVSFEKSEDANARVVCYEKEDDKHSVSVEADTLSITRHTKPKLFININLYLEECPKVTVFLPKEDYENLSIVTDTGSVSLQTSNEFSSISIETDTGRISCSGASCSDTLRLESDTGRIEMNDTACGEFSCDNDTGAIILNSLDSADDIIIKNDTGRIEIDGAKCKDFSCENDTGAVVLKNVISSGSFNIDCDTGSIEFENCDAGSAEIMSHTGSINGTFLSGKTFDVKSDTGKIDVPNSASGGRCTVKTDTGNIKINICSDELKSQ